MNWCVYFLYCEATHELLYIGRSNAPRRRLTAFRRKHGIEVVQECLSFDSMESASKAELQLIVKYNPPFNRWLISSTGFVLGKHSAAGAERIRAANRRKHTQEENRRVSEALQGRAPTIGFTGRKHTEKAKQKLRGRNVSLEARANMSKAQRARQERARCDSQQS